MDDLKQPIKLSDKEQFQQLLAQMRAEAEARGFLTDDEINAEIQAARADFDYTKWCENLWEDLTPRELFERAAKTVEEYGIPQGITVI